MEGNLRGLPPPQTYTIGGIKVEFPTKAYPSQIAMMNMVIQGLKTKQNCLLESPTGSGKSLALLCASLAWQRHEMERIAKINAGIDERQQGKAASGIPKSQKDGVQNSFPQTEQEGVACCKEKDVWMKEPTASFSLELTDDEDDFQPPKRTKHSASPFKGSNSVPMSKFDVKLPMEFGDNEEPTEKLTYPKIFFGTRTHKQIAQITRELRKTSYRNARSAILASRDRTCVNPLVENVDNKNEACKELLDSVNKAGGGCGWHLNAKKFGNFENLAGYGVGPGYDLEDLVAAGRAIKACPYYATRNLMSSADIIFCPYNYLVEPHIRKSMSIELHGQIVIFDEAHNMEDSSRSAASFTVLNDDIRSGMQDCEKIAMTGTDELEHRELAHFLHLILVWIHDESKTMTELDFNTEGKHWNGTEFMGYMGQIGVLDRIQDYKAHFQLISEKREAEQDIARERGRSRMVIEVPKLNVATMDILEDLFRMLDFFMKNGGKHRDDFRVAILQTRVSRRNSGYKHPGSKLVMSLNFWCLNPAVTFNELKAEVHCIILTSGTLSPIQSFQSELGTPFPIKLEASHVIDHSQIWAYSISSGPRNVSLNGSYQNAETYAYQDELGNLVLRVCNVMPHGVLCFFPSYRLLDKVVERWRVTERWHEIQGLKDIYVEPRTGNADFQRVIMDFYHSIDLSNDGPIGTVTGALFLAVCRGKVSEGLDFANNNARAVICIGIPFPNYKDLQVGLKKDYNDKNRNRGLLPGGEWYEIQAFRALNQALGRCIRHRYDWGAILLVDDRFQKTPRYLNSLSKWVRASVQHRNSWRETEQSLAEFRDKMFEMLPQPQREQPIIDLDTENGSAGSAGSLLGYSDGFSGFGSGSIPDSPGFSNLNVNDSKSPLFGNTSTPTRMFPVFANVKVKPKVKKRSPIEFDEGQSGTD